MATQESLKKQLEPVKEKKQTGKKRQPKRLTVTELQDRIILLGLQDKIYLCRALKEQIKKEAEGLHELTEDAKSL
jgi:hypothetical protein